MVSKYALRHLAEYFKVLSEVSRLQILCCLREGPLNVTEIVEKTGMGQANTSKHLKLMVQAGLIARVPQGVNAYYEIVDPAIFELCELACQHLALQMEEQTSNLRQLAALGQR